MGEVSTIGLDIAKSVFQIHGVDVDGAVVMRRRITRAKLLDFFATLPACLVGIEACPTAHYWSRQLQGLGHTVRLLPPSYVKAYFSLCLRPKFYRSLIMVRDQGRSIISPEGLLTWNRAWKTAFANAPMKCGPHMAACTAKRSSTGLRPNGNSWRHRRQSSPANQIRRRTHGRPHVRRPPERSWGLADAADLARDASPCSAAISTKSDDYARGLVRRSGC